MTTEPQKIGIFFKDFKDLTMERVNVLQRRVFLGIAKMVIESTPVASGRARGGWHADVNDMTPGPTNFQGSGSAASTLAYTSVLGASAAHEDGQDLTLANGVSYIRYLNAGSSQQAPAGMTDQAIQAFSRFVTIESQALNK